jgi:hypothetical protein
LLQHYVCCNIRLTLVVLILPVLSIRHAAILPERCSEVARQVDGKGRNLVAKLVYQHLQREYQLLVLNLQE